jgi:hypothetical protein
MRLIALIDTIESGYAAGLTMYDPPILGATEELSGRTDDIRRLVNALRVFTKTPHLVSLLEAVDPQALAQARDALE